MRAPIVLPLVLALAACSTSSECGPTAVCVAERSAATSVAGSWKEVETWRGISMQVSLAASDTSLAGSATYTGSGGTQGTAAVTGYVSWQDAMPVPSGGVMPAHPVVVLLFAFSDGTSARFDQAVLQGQDSLSGALTFSDQATTAYGTTFTRTR